MHYFVTGATGFIGKRLVKMPKLYFYDTGLLCHLLRIADAQTLSALRSVVA